MNAVGSVEVLRETPRKGQDGGQTVLDDRADDGVGRGRGLDCAACGLRITTESARFEMSGAHQHTFVNPHGHVFQIGCFRHAPGCAPHGAASNFFSWFPGYAWRVVVCSACKVHLGWSFGVPADFWGLILDRLADGDD